MTGHRSFSKLTKGFTPERRARVAAKAAGLREAMTLEELRKARSLSQEDVAATMEVGQPAVAGLVKRNDMHVSNLRRYLEALAARSESRLAFRRRAWCSPTSARKPLRRRRTLAARAQLDSRIHYIR